MVRTNLLSLLELSETLLPGLLLALSLLQQRLWDEDLILRRHGPVRKGISTVRRWKIAESELQLWRGILKLVIGVVTRRNGFHQ